MTWFTRLYFLFCRMIASPVVGLVRPSLVQLDDQLSETLAGKPVCYVLRQHSWTDRFLLEKVLRKQDLPMLRARPGKLPDAERAACLYFPLLNGDLGSERRQQLIDNFLNRGIAEDDDYPLQMVPVSIFWGRDPGSETSFWRLLLGDGNRGGVLRKLLVIIAQRKSVILHFAEPVAFDKLFARSESPERAVALLARTLSFYFSRKKTATLGPSLLSRQQIINVVLRRPAVRDAIAGEIASGSDAAKAEKSARKMAEEVAANFDSRLLRVLELILAWVFRKLFSGIRVHHVDRLRRVANDRQIVYMPSHRSHLDYLLISYSLYMEGLVPPHIAAGVNLNFWPVGGLLRRGGAFYIRRSFGGQRLYSAVFKAYLDVLLGRGYPVEFFPEGGRSRTGRLLPPKKGMLRMVLESYLQQPARKVAIVPVYVAYDKLVEGTSYAKELRGAAKKNESAGGLLKARKIFKSSYGSPHVSFGEPISLDESLTQVAPQWRRRAQGGDSAFLSEVVDGIAQQNMERINAAAVVNAIGLVAMILLASPQRAMAKDELLSQIDHFIVLLRRLPYSHDVILPEGSAEEIFDQAARTAGLSEIAHPWGPIITATGNEAVMLTYYRNSVMHVLALPSLIARFFRHSYQIDRRELIDSCAMLYPFLKQELFINIPEDQVAGAIADHIDNLVEIGLLFDTPDGALTRARVGSEAYAVLTGLGRILRETFERYTVSSLFLVEDIRSQGAARAEIERHIIEMAQRLAIVSGREAPEYFDKNLFRGYLDTLIRQRLLRVMESEAGQYLELDPRLGDLAQRWVALLGPDVQQSMLQLIRKPEIKAKSGE
ncbi:glycerol-3-phosphate 1-O-acyltransferase PlsB [Spongiibacter taiwanensis]|uniref:glycerol-3-phosphate 1-O-acyltransferase PlsB n=1 Tax=Spongiibacter taiwanensis TaxID=1748242 RepID=UPI002035BD01|nr:glycerol-3-phosphate 1-O-acyltransferase PlsB [Spongiibacter taiwanensis]USA43864.1 glycerol-3-phosphate 1-O-acyltransferase PlsB [Spongiibacter taiwanensis]